MTKNDLVGTWKLKWFEVIHKNGTVDRWGPASHGTLIYTPEGTMSAAVNGENANEQVFYSGTFDLESSDTVVHRVTESAKRLRIGDDQIRKATLTGDELVLEAFGPFTNARITWIRLKV
jgi:hypothetical protein